MPVNFENFQYSFQRNGKPIFVPSEIGRKIGIEVKRKVEACIQFEDFYYHLRSGGHVAALHAHRNNKFFARLDIEKFFYSIARNRVARSLKHAGVERPIHFAKWSTVRNPYPTDGYVLPYGFVQSPILASLVLKDSAIGRALSQISKHLTVSVFVDDISISGGDIKSTIEGFEYLEAAFVESGFNTNSAKTRSPAEEIDAFNCDLRHKSTTVLLSRISEFNLIERSIQSQTAFENYCQKVALGNIVD